MFALPGVTQAARPRLAAFDFGSALSDPALRLPEALVSEARGESLRSFATSVPLRWHWGMFELRMLDTKLDVDLLGGMLPDEASCATAEPHTHRAIEATRPLLDVWSRDDGLRDVPCLWYEWDQASAERAPLLWLCVDPHFFTHGSLAASPAHVRRLIERFFSADAQYASPATYATAQRLAEALPEHGRVVAAATLKPRGVEAMRLYLRLPRQSLPLYLERIGWRGDFLGVTRYLDIANPRFEWSYCQVEIDHDVRPYLALELGQSDPGFPERASRRRWFERLVADGLADRARVEAVMAWPGEEPMRSQMRTSIVRSLHTKLVLPAVGAPEAKAYLGFNLLRD